MHARIGAGTLYFLSWESICGRSKSQTPDPKASKLQQQGPVHRHTRKLIPRPQQSALKMYHTRPESEALNPSCSSHGLPGRRLMFCRGRAGSASIASFALKNIGASLRDSSANT